MTLSKIGQPLRETADWSDVQTWSGTCSMDSADIWHRSQRDPAIASESLTQCRISVSEIPGEDGFNVMVRDTYQRLIGRYAGEQSVTWYESPVFPTLRSAQLFAEWALERWHCEGSFSHAGFKVRFDLDEQGNPYS